MSRSPLIIFVPGLRPKPQPADYVAQMLRCLHEGVRRIDESIAADLTQRGDCFELVAWTFPFYGVHNDIDLDQSGVDALLKRQRASELDRAEATSWQMRLLRSLYILADRMPFQVPPFGNEKLELHLKDLRRYARNRKGVAESTRSLLKKPLLDAAEQGRPTLLIGHSMGSVIAFDTLWQLSHESKGQFQLDTLLTLGSPLGQNLVRRNLLGHAHEGAARYPSNVQKWINIANKGDLTAINMQLAADFAEMTALGLIDRIEDRVTFGFFRDGGDDGDLNVHSEYGYLINEVTAGVIADWWVRAAGQAGFS